MPLSILDLTLSNPHKNLACDEALLDWCERGEGGDILRFWESPDYFVVLGYTKAREAEVDTAACRVQGVPILRRTTGGGTVLQGPGCFNYSLILRIEGNPELLGITETNRFIMERQRAALERVLGEPVSVSGFTDLVWRGRKFSGNAQRRRQRFLLFHGTFLIDFDLELLARLLRQPAVQPAYRAQRPHREFVDNLHCSRDELRSSLRAAWDANTVLESIPMAEIDGLAASRYSSDEWNLKF